MKESRCECCGNEYEKVIEIKLDGKTHKFDCFECAIHKLAPECQHCGVKVVGHGVQVDSIIFCCAHCARVQGAHKIIDHVVTDEMH